MRQAALAVFCLWLAVSPTLAFARPPDFRAGLLLNLSSGKVLWERNADLGVPPASLAKIMTMFLTLDAVKAGQIGMNQKISVTGEAASIGGSRMGLVRGEKVPVIRLLAGTAVASGNDAATALAIKLGKSQKKFAAKMNSKARSLGMKNTRFKNPTGLPAAGQITTARDLAKLCRAYLSRHPEAMRFHGMKFLAHKGSALRSTNPLLGFVPGTDGLKTGWTVASGYNIIATAKRGKTRLLAIILGARTKRARENAARSLLEAGFLNPRSPLGVKKSLDWS